LKLFSKVRKRAWFCALALGLVVGYQSAQAANLTWDTSTAAGFQPGAGGNWDTSTLTWSTAGTTLVAWSQTNATTATNAAIFAGADGSYAMNLATGIAASAVTVSNSGYTLSATSAQTLNVTGTGALFTIANGKTFSVGNNSTIQFNAVSNTGTRYALGTGAIFNINTGATLLKTAGVGLGGFGFRPNVAGDAATINVSGTIQQNSPTAGSGSLTFAESVAGTITVNALNGSVITTNTDGGQNSKGAITVGDAGTAILNVNPGAQVSVTNTASTSYLCIGGTSNAGVGTVNLDGGTVTVPRVAKKGTGTATGTLNFNGGTLSPNSSAFDTFALPFIGSSTTNNVLNLDRANIRNGGAVINTNGFNATIAQPLLHSNIGGDNATDGGLAKNGAGVLTLAGANAFTGPVSVNTGTLAFNTNTSTIGTLSVANGANLNTKLAAGGTNLVESGNVTLGTNTLTFDFNLLNPTATFINSSGTLTTGAASSLSVSFLNTTNLVSGSYRLIDYAPATTIGGGGIAAFPSGPVSLGGRSSGIIQNDVANTAVVFNVSADTITWSGASSSNWVTATTGDNTPPNNWTTVSALTNTNFWASDVVTFGDTYDNTNSGGGPASVTNRAVDISAANVSPAQVTFNNSAGDYTVGSSGAFGIATGNIIKNGSSKATITTTNTTTGLVTVNTGTLQIGDGTTDGSIASASSINVAGASAILDYKLIGTQSYANVISGLGTVVKEGAGTLTLSNTGNTVDNLTIKSGTVSINNNGNLADVLNTLDGGTLKTTNTSSIAILRPVTVTANNGTLTVGGAGVSGQGSRVIFSAANTLQGNGTLTVNGNAGVGGLASAVAGGQGWLVVTSANTGFTGNVNLSGGSFEYDNATPVSTGTVFTVGNESELTVANGRTVTNNVTVNGGSNSFLSFNNSAGFYSGTITLNADANIGLRNWYNYAAAINGTVSGSLQGAGGIILNRGTSVTAAVLTLSGVNTYSGNTTINTGTTLTVSGTGQLGSGSYAGNIINNGGYIHTSTANQILSGIISGSGTVAAQAASVLTLSGANTYSGKTTINGGGVVNVTSFNSVNGGTPLFVSSSLGSPTTIPNGTIDMTGNLGNATIVYSGTGEITDRVINLAAGASAGQIAILDQSGSGLLKFTSSVTATGVQPHTLALQGSTSGTGEFAGVIVDNSVVNLTSVSKDGSGTWTLSGSNIYTGPTNINAGTLLVQGVNSGGGAVTVFFNATLGGNGSVAGPVTANAGGTVSPGASIGTLTLGSLTLNGSLLAQYDGSALPNQIDMLVVSGNLDISSATSEVDFANIGSTLGGPAYVFASYSTLTGSGFTVVNGLPASYAIDYNYLGGNQIALVMVPEPSTLVLGFVGIATMLGLSISKRRRQLEVSDSYAARLER
jgi:autotransporter-associated beta strand protein